MKTPPPYFFKKLKMRSHGVCRSFFRFFYLTFLLDFFIGDRYNYRYELHFRFPKEGGVGNGTEKEGVCPALQFR